MCAFWKALGELGDDMTNYEITQMARDAGLMPTVLVPWAFELNKFARLVAAKEREACIECCTKVAHHNQDVQLHLMADGAFQCAELIDSRTSQS